MLFPTEAGTPQGGIISPSLANLTLDGLGRLLKETFRPRKIRGKLFNPRGELSSAMPMTSSLPEARRSFWRSEVKPLVERLTARPGFAALT